jgi:phospholipid/cholesterol/gamma-HCH transport system substrate-binding protein
VVGLLLAMAGSLFVAGGGSDLLEDTYTLHGSWEDVGGLKEGAVVRLAGWDVGEVSRIRFSDDLGVKELSVEMRIFKQYQDRIRADSEARIDTVGVLGDKYVAISMGDPEEKTLAHGEFIDTRPPIDIVEYTKKVAEVLESTSSISHKVDLILGSDQEAADAALSQSFTHLENILAQAEHGDGLIHTLFYDKTIPQKIDLALEDAGTTLAGLKRMSEDLEHATGAIREGDGLAHELIYGENGKALAVRLSQLAGKLNQIAGDLESSEGLVSTLIYDPESAQILDDLKAVASHLEVFSATLNDADGTLSLLVEDPMLYEDLRALVGGAQRNKLLRAYIRKTVEKGEEVTAQPWEPVESP